MIQIVKAVKIEAAGVFRRLDLRNVLSEIVGMLVRIVALRYELYVRRGLMVIKIIHIEMND